MPRQTYSAREAASMLGISLDTLRRWDKVGRVRVQRDARNRRVVPASEVDRLRGDATGRRISARNRFPGLVTDVQTDGLMAQVEIAVSSPVRIISVITRSAAEEIGLKPGMSTTAIVKATNVLIQS